MAYIDFFSNVVIGLVESNFLLHQCIAYVLVVLSAGYAARSPAS